MSIIKNSMAISIVALMASAYFYPEDETKDTHNNADFTQATSSLTATNQPTENSNLPPSWSEGSQQLQPSQLQLLLLPLSQPQLPQLQLPV